MIALTLGVLLLMIHQGQCAMEATAVLYGHNSTTSYGTLTFYQSNINASVRITGSISGLNISNEHGFHIHVHGVSDSSPNCDAAGPHFNPYNTSHGSREANKTHRHVGDLGNLKTNANGTVTINMTDSIIQLYEGIQSILNRTVVVHAMIDDNGEGGFPDSATTGHAGARLFCGRVVLSNAWSAKPVMLIYYAAIITAILVFF